MNASASPRSPLVTAPAAALGAVHGYQFNADQVELTATFRVLDAAAHRRSWLLQLWACTAAPAADEPLRGQLVASAALPPLAEIADPVESFTVHAGAILPTGADDHVMVLALASATADGRGAEIHDRAAYPRRESFALPRLENVVLRGLDAGRAAIAIGSIFNPRAPGNSTGTLAVELWALPAPYAAGNFTGHPVAGAILGSLGGQCRWTDLALDLVAHPPAQTSFLVVMLREWNGAGYVTRDFVNAPGLFVVATPPAAVAVPAAAVATVAPVTAKPAKPAVRPGVNVNAASVEELTTVKGLPRPVAKGIIAARPVRRLDDLMKVKGMGPKLFAKLRDFLRID